MKMEFCCSNNLVAHILNRIACDPECVFSESELSRICPKTFRFLKDQRFIVWRQFDFKDPFFSSIPGDQDNPRYLKDKGNGKYDAFAGDDAALPCVEVTDKDVPHWEFDVAKLVDAIRAKNDLDEPADVISSRLRFVGSKDGAGGRVGVFLALHDTADDLARELTGLPHNTGKCARYLVISPCLRISSQKTINTLERINVDHQVVGEAFTGDLTLKSGALVGEVKAGQPDSLYLTGKIEDGRHVVRIGNRDGGLTEANFKLLIRLVVGLKDSKDGFVGIGTMADDGVIPDSDQAWQAVKRLKDDLKQSFAGLEFDDFIANGRKKYRLVIAPDAVGYDKKMLRKIKNTTINDFVAKLP